MQTGLSEPRAMRTVGVIGTGRQVGTTHFAVMAGNYLNGIRRHKTGVLEWNCHGDFEKMAKHCLERPGKDSRGDRSNHRYQLLDVNYFEKAGTEDLLLCKTEGFRDVIVDYGAVEDGHLDQFLRCDRQFVLGSLTEWQADALLEFAGQWGKRRAGWQTLIVFGSEESRIHLEKKLKSPILRVPVSMDAFAVTGELLQFYQRILE